MSDSRVSLRITAAVFAALDATLEALYVVKGHRASWMQVDILGETSAREQNKEIRLTGTTKPQVFPVESQRISHIIEAVVRMEFLFRTSESGEPVIGWRPLKAQLTLTAKYIVVWDDKGVATFRVI